MAKWTWWTMVACVFVLGVIWTQVECRKSGGNPAPKVLPGFKKLAHGVTSGNVTIVDTRRIRIKAFKYDGAGPDVFFWVGKGDRPNKDGKKVPDEKGSYDKLRGYTGEDIELTLPSDVSVHDIGYLAVYCRRYSTNFGHVTIPNNLNVPRY